MPYDYKSNLESIANTNAINQAGADFRDERRMMSELLRQELERKKAERKYKKGWVGRGLGKGLGGALQGGLMGLVASGGNPLGALAGAGAGFGAGFVGEGIGRYTGDEATGNMISGMGGQLGGAIGGQMAAAPTGPNRPMTEREFMAKNPGGSYGNYMAQNAPNMSFNQADLTQALSTMSPEEQQQLLRSLGLAGPAAGPVASPQRYNLGAGYDPFRLA